MSATTVVGVQVNVHSWVRMEAQIKARVQRDRHQAQQVHADGPARRPLPAGVTVTWPEVQPPFSVPNVAGVKALHARCSCPARMFVSSLDAFASLPVPTSAHQLVADNRALVFANIRQAASHFGVHVTENLWQELMHRT